MRPIRWASLGIGAGLCLLSPALAAAAELTTPGEVNRTVAVRDVALEGSRLTATLVNESGYTLENLRLLAQVVFHWNDEFHPGPVSPGRAATLVVPGPIAPGGTQSVSVVFDPALDGSAPGVFRPVLYVMGYRAVGAR